MKWYIAKRVLAIMPIILCISFLTFIFIALSPSDPAEVALRVNAIVPTPETIASMRQELGLDRPLMTQYFSWLKGCLNLDFGTSYITRTPVSEEFGRAFPHTLYLAGVALVIIIFFSVTLGALCAANEGSKFDIIARGLIFWTAAMPDYWIGLLLMWLFAVNLNLLPIGGVSHQLSVILPAITLSFGYVGTYARLIRNSMLENMQENYAFYARVRGLNESSIIWKHVFLNSLKTSITALGMGIPKLMAGLVIVENIFAWPGIGRLCVIAIFNRDFPVIQTYILFMALLFIVFNLIADIINAYLDPKLWSGG